MWLPRKVARVRDLVVTSDAGHTRWVQDVLSRHGFPAGPSDGVYGPRTRSAVIRYQAAYAGVAGGPVRLAPDGIAGPRTAAGLKLLPALSDHFSTWEVDCRCCGRAYVDGRLLAALEVLRARIGHRPVALLSVYRCERHNAAVGGARASQHLEGRAADLRSHVAADIVRDVGLFGGLGTRGSRASHVDVRQVAGLRWDRPVPGVDSPVTWSYG